MNTHVVKFPIRVRLIAKYWANSFTGIQNLKNGLDCLILLAILAQHCGRFFCCGHILREFLLVSGGNIYFASDRDTRWYKEIQYLLAIPV